MEILGTVLICVAVLWGIRQLFTITRLQEGVGLIEFFEQHTKDLSEKKRRILASKHNSRPVAVDEYPGEDADEDEEYWSNLANEDLETHKANKSSYRKDEKGNYVLKDSHDTRFSFSVGPWLIKHEKNWGILLLLGRDRKGHGVTNPMGFERFDQRAYLITPSWQKNYLINWACHEKTEFSINKPKIYIHDEEGECWSNAGDIKINRALFVYNEEIKNRIFEDVNNFIKMRNEYIDRDFAFKRGYLLHGPPGNGKSSIVMLLAVTYGISVFEIRLNPQMTGESLRQLVSSANSSNTLYILLLEDIDSCIDGREVIDGGVKFSDILNILDGVVSIKNCILVMTTNIPQSIDNALRRPGRVDIEVEIPAPTEDMLREYFQKILIGADEGKTDEFMRRVKLYSAANGLDVSMALAKNIAFAMILEDKTKKPSYVPYDSSLSMIQVNEDLRVVKPRSINTPVGFKQ